MLFYSVDFDFMRADDEELSAKIASENKLDHCLEKQEQNLYLYIATSTNIKAAWAPARQQTHHVKESGM